MDPAGLMSNPAMQDAMLQMLETPGFQEQMRTVMSNPEVFRATVLVRPVAIASG